MTKKFSVKKKTLKKRKKEKLFIVHCKSVPHQVRARRRQHVEDFPVLARNLKSAISKVKKSHFPNNGVTFEVTPIELNRNRVATLPTRSDEITIS